MALGIDGLISGIETSAMIKQLMDIEARPQVLLKTRVSSTQTFVTALQNLNTKIASWRRAPPKYRSPPARTSSRPAPPRTR